MRTSVLLLLTLVVVTAALAYAQEPPKRSEKERKRNEVDKKPGRDPKKPRKYSGREDSKEEDDQKKPKQKKPLRKKHPRDPKVVKEDRDEDCPGVCIDKKSQCKRGQIQGTCAGSKKLCCVRSGSRSGGKDVKPQKGTNPKRFCNPTDLCKPNGECRKSKTGCKRNEKRYKNTDDEKYCTKDSCICCKIECESMTKCNKLNGECILKKAQKYCDGMFIKGKKYCEGKGCGCCFDPDNVDCQTRTKCANEGGSCQSASAECSGDVLSGKKYCKNYPACVCCLEDGGGPLTWSYLGELNGVDRWPGIFENCGGSSQSPIDIVPDNAVGDYNWPHFFFHYYDEAPSSAEIINDGHTAKLTVATDHVPTIGGGGLPGEYIFAQLHFHWGADNTKGSEHTVNGNSYPMEIHFVHFKAEYGDLMSALGHGDGLAVLGFFFEIGDENNAAYNLLLDGIDKIHDAGTAVDVTPFALEDLFADDMNDFYRYSGSLTTPTCNEVVVWTVFKTPISISNAQIAKFRLLYDSHQEPLVDNFRPPQPLNGRTVSKGYDEGTWSYDGSDGPDRWANNYETCGDNSQSPIDIVVADVAASPVVAAFTFVNYGTATIALEMANNGHTATISTPDTSNLPTISGGGLTDDYIFAGFHFHWGSIDTQGSEHTVGGVSYPAELHLVHYKASYGDLVSALTHADGLAVLGVFMELGAANANLNPVTSKLANIADAGTAVDITSFALEDLLPTNKDFWRYSGSLTTPSCNEIVTWTVFKNPISMSAEQLEQFRSLKDKHGNPLVDTFRPTLPVNGRPVTQHT